MLDYETDLVTRKSLYGLPSVDEEYHVELANKLNQGESWQEKLKLALDGPNKLHESEFYYYQLYDPRVTPNELANYVGKQRQIEFHEVCNSPFWIATSQDKALLELVLKGAGLSVSTSSAIYSTRPRSGFPECLQNRDDLLNFLRRAEFPLFAKPIDGIFGIGAFRINGFDGHVMDMNDGHLVKFDDAFEYISKITPSGYLFQPLISQSHYMNEHFGTAVCTVRFLVLNAVAPCLESALVKIAGSRSVADNFWQEGNMLAALDLETGGVVGALRNTGTRHKRIDHNPDTGYDFDGLELENWSETVEFVLEAAALFPGVCTQSWDIAMTTSGPMVVEFNWGGDLNLHQLANRRGALTGGYREHIALCGGRV